MKTKQTSSKPLTKYVKGKGIGYLLLSFLLLLTIAIAASCGGGGGGGDGGGGTTPTWNMTRYVWYSGAGADGVWFNGDDVVSGYGSYTY